VWTRRKSATRMRPWIATVTAYALALQVLLTGVAAGHAMPSGNASATGLFVICHGEGSSDRQDLPDKQPLAQSPCMFCTLAKATCAILPPGHGIVISNAIGISNPALQSDGRIIAFHSPTGQYQRGPPLSIPVFG
jgi:DUF2946 family protein